VGSRVSRGGSGAALLAIASLGLASIAACSSPAGNHSDGGLGGAPGGGDGGGGAICGSVAACGGAVVGRWNITDVCVTGDMDLSDICTGITASIVLSVSGSATYNADLTYTQTGTQGGTVRYHFPTACLGTQTCAQVQANLLSAGSAAGMGLTFQSGTCFAEIAGCQCNAILTSSSADETGTYRTGGGTLTTTHDGTEDANRYCVNGNTMHQMVPETTGAVVLTKQ
jgi:hypothetical protein